MQGSQIPTVATQAWGFPSSGAGAEAQEVPTEKLGTLGSAERTLLAIIELLAP